MTDATKLINVLDFYVKVNELKNKLVWDNHDSIADHLFGSMILATTVNSEFGNEEDMVEVCKMLLLYQFSCAYPKYEFPRAIKERIDEIKRKEGPWWKIIFKYETLDFLLTRLLREKGETLSEEKLVEEGCVIISLLCKKEPSECEEIFRFYIKNFALKNKQRSGWDDTHWNVKTPRRETVSEHIVGTLSLAVALNNEFKHPIDSNKVFEMLTIHETGETLMADVTPFDGKTEAEKQEEEHIAMARALGGLKEKGSFLALLFEFDARVTKESRFAHYCDKLEADLQSKIYQEKGMHHTLDDQENNVTYRSKRIQEILRNGAKDAFDVWYLYDRAIYNDPEFRVFLDLIDFAKENSILDLQKTQAKIKDE